MGHIDDCVGLLREGYTPSEIAHRVGISTASVVGYLYRGMGKGDVLPSDLVLVFRDDVREALDVLSESMGSGNWFHLYLRARDEGLGLESEEVRLLLTHRSALSGDLYIHMTRMEVSLHQVLKQILRSAFGGRDAWWLSGVPEKTRRNCESRKNASDDPSREPYSFTNFCDIGKIIDQNWLLIRPSLPLRERRDKGRLLRHLDRANRIRNNLMHPVSLYTPSRADFAFVVSLARRLHPTQWRLPPAPKSSDA